MNAAAIDCKLIVTVVAGAGAAERLQAALGAGPVASLIIAAPEGTQLAAAAVEPLVRAAQAAGTAALLADDARLARTLKADGVHLAFSDAVAKHYEEAREILGTRFILGGDAGRSRHDAMALGESGADYVGFGIPSFVGERDKARRRRAELIAWWAEIFEVPCVAFDVDDADDAAELAGAGADFVGLVLDNGTAPAEAAERVRAIAAAIADAGTRARV